MVKRKIIENLIFRFIFSVVSNVIILVKDNDSDSTVSKSKHMESL